MHRCNVVVPNSSAPATGNRLLTFSVVTASFNQGQFIGSNIQSVREQRYPHVEHHVVDGGSKDDTLYVLRSSDDVKWSSEADRGQSDAINKGLMRATGDVIAWINSDDRLAPNALHRVAQFFVENPEEVGVVGDLAVIDDQGNRTAVWPSRSYSHDYLVNYAKGVTQPSLFFRREALSRTGLLDENLHYVMDRDFFIRLSSIRDIPYLPTVLAEFRLHDASKTSQGSYRFAMELLRVRRRYGGRWLSPGMRSDIYLIVTEPLRRIGWLRTMVQRIRRWLD